MADKTEKYDKFLDDIVKKKGRIVISELVDLARKKTCPIHDRFEWDDDIASHEFRLLQGRRLVRLYSLRKKAEDQLVHVPPAPEPKKVTIEKGDVPELKREGEYRPVQMLTRSEYERALDEAMKYLSAARRNVEVMQRVTQEDDTKAVIALALKGMNTVHEALQRLH